jgi:hypothetical protein
MTLEDPSFVQLGSFLVALGVASFGVFQYWRSVNVRRSEWIYKFYSEFYVEPIHKTVRDKLDSDDGKRDIERVIRNVKNLTNEDRQLRNSFSDYLNFFEFLLYLKKIHVISGHDIEDMFGYYLDVLAKSNDIKEFVEDYGYGLLSNYLTKKQHNWLKPPG